MAGGDVCTQLFNVISSAPVEPVAPLDIPNSTVTDCCFSLPVLATLAGTIDSENDQSSFLVARELNITVPTPHTFLKNILVLEFIGDGDLIAPMLKDKNPKSKRYQR